jgi:hypothetical protein
MIDRHRQLYLEAAVYHPQCRCRCGARPIREVRYVRPGERLKNVDSSETTPRKRQCDGT